MASLPEGQYVKYGLSVPNSWQMPGGRLWKGIHSKSSSQVTQSYSHRRTSLSLFSLRLWTSIFNFKQPEVTLQASWICWQHWICKSL